MSCTSNPDGTEGARGPLDLENFRRLPAPQPRDVIRSWDRRATLEYGIPGAVLMENAGAAAARFLARLARRDPRTYREPFLVLCGPGNNGGDGFVVARYLHDWGFEVALRVSAGVRYAEGSEARIHLDVVTKLGIPISEPASHELARAGTIIDAFSGTGLSRPLGSPWIDWVRAVNASGRPVIALDIPSGLDADSGEILGEAVRARHTITFAASKLGFSRGRGPERCGTVHVVDIGIPAAVMRDPPQGR